MPFVSFTKALKRFYPNLENKLFVEGENILEVMNQVDDKYPGIKDYILEENGHLRKHVNIFLGEDPIEDRLNLSDTLGPKEEVYIIQALSGG